MENLEQNSVMLVVRLSRPGNRRKVPSAMVEVDADRDAISVGKELLDCEELKAVVTHDGAIRRYIYTRSLPSAVLKEGVYRLPLALVDEVEAGLSELQSRRQALIDEFIRVYPTKMADAEFRLRVLYNPHDYPPADAVKDAFGMEWRYVTLGIPRTLSQEMIEQERAKASRDVQAEVEEIRLALRTSFAELVDHAAERLKTGPDGKKVVFRDSLVENLEQFMAYFTARNITGDSDLAALVERARSVLHGVAPEDLRSQDDLRHHIQRTMEQIKDSMERNRLLAPTRRFALEPVKV